MNQEAIFMTSKGSWDSLAVPLFSWVIALTLLMIALGLALVNYGDFAEALRVLR